jgi:SAM-dependent methyltransferase
MAFICNICGTHNHVESFETEPASCACGSNVRLRALIHLLSIELFGQDLVVAEFQKLKGIRGLGISDQASYARILADKFDYTNTFYDREPHLDLSAPHPQVYGTYDFILLADVIEHIAPPIERALEEAGRLLKPHGFLGITIFCNPIDQMREHFPELNEFRIVPLGKSPVLVNRRRDGTLEIRDDLIFHGGPGATLEMREFGITELTAKLLAAGFLDVHLLTDNLPRIGVLFDQHVSQPLIARKQPYVMDKCVRSQMIDEWRTLGHQAAHQHERAQQLADQIRLAADSRWLRLGRKLGLGPKFEPPG